MSHTTSRDGFYNNSYDVINKFLSQSTYKLINASL